MDLIRKHQFPKFVKNKSEKMSSATVAPPPHSLVDGGYSHSLHAGLSALWRQGLVLDYTLVAGDTSFKVHKVLLAALCDYFQAAFRSGMKEAHEDRLELKGVSSRGLAQVVNYLYTGVVEVTWESLPEVIHTASLLQCLPVLDLCMDYLAARINLSTYTEIRTLADTYALGKLQKAVHQFVLDNFRVFAKTELFKQLAAEEVSQYLSMDTLKCHSEFKIFKLAVDWVFFDRENREQLAPLLFQHIRFPFMSKQELKKVRKHRLIVREPLSRVYVEEAKQYKMSREQSKVLHSSLRTKVRSRDYVVTFGCTEQAMHSCVLYKGVWYPLDRALGQPRPFVNAACVVVNNYLFVCAGGLHEAECTNTCFQYDPCTSKWKQLANMTLARRNFGLAAMHGRLYAIGGIREDEGVTSSVEVYSIKEDHWQYCCNMATAAADLAVCCHDDLLYTAGGVDETNLHTRDFKTFNPENQHWTKCSQLLSIKFRPRLFVTGTNLHLLDLYPSEGSTPTLDTYSTSSKQWTSLTLPGVQFSRYFGAAQIGEWVYFVGRNEVDAGRSKKLQLLNGEVEDIQSYPWCIDAPLCCVLKIPPLMLHNKIVREVEG